MIALTPVAAFAQVASTRVRSSSRTSRRPCRIQPTSFQVQALHYAKVSDALDTSNVMAEESIALIKTVRALLQHLHLKALMTYLSFCQRMPYVVAI
jgi:hypothetical protein